MSKHPPFFDDLSKLAMSAGATMLEWRKEVEKVFHSQIEKWSRGMDLVTREEFEVVRDLAQKAVQENETLKARIEQLEGEKASSTAESKKPAKGKSKPTTAKTTKSNKD